MRVEGAQSPGLGLHPGGRGAPAAVHRGKHVDGVVAGVEEDTAPQVRHPVGASLGDAHQAAAVADALQFLLGDGVPDAAGQHREDGEGEEGLERAGGRQFAMGVVRGEHPAGAGVGHQPRECGDVLGDLGGSGSWPYLRPGPVQRRLRGRGSRRRVRAGSGGDRARREGQGPGHTDGGTAGGGAGRESDGHSANVGTYLPYAGVPGPTGGIEHPDAACGRCGRQ